MTITRHGHPVVALKAISEAPRALSPADLDWLAARRVGRAAVTEDAGTLLRVLRDDEQK